MDQVVEDDLERRVANVVVAVVDDEQRVAPVLAVPRRQVHADLAAAELLGVDDDLVGGARARLRVGLDPFRRAVARAVHHRVRAERVARVVGVERVLHPLAVAAADDLELVLDARPRRDLEREVPDVGAFEPRQLLRRRQAVDPVLEVDGVGVAAPHDRDALVLDDRELVAALPRVDRGLAALRDRHAHELGEPLGGRRHLGHASMRAVVGGAVARPRADRRSRTTLCHARPRSARRGRARRTATACSGARARRRGGGRRGASRDRAPAAARRRAPRRCRRRGPRRSPCRAAGRRGTARPGR